MSKMKFTPRGPWQATGMQKLRIPKDDPRKLRMKAEELKLKAGRLVSEADELIAQLLHQLAESFAAQRSGLEQQWEKSDSASTEDLRQALRRYRSFCDRLLSI